MLHGTILYWKKKALIYEYFYESENKLFGHISYGILTLEHNKAHINIYKKIINYMMDLLDLESTKDDGQEKLERQKSGRFYHF